MLIQIFIPRGGCDAYFDAERAKAMLKHCFDAVIGIEELELTADDVSVAEPVYVCGHAGLIRVSLLNTKVNRTHDALQNLSSQLAATFHWVLPTTTVEVVIEKIDPAIIEVSTFPGFADGT
jgi:hypothetical protein